MVIVNWNGRNVVQECLIGAKKQSLKEFSIILVDNGSSDGSLELVNRNFPEVKIDELVKSRHPGENRGPEVLQVPKKTGFRLSPE